MSRSDESLILSDTYSFIHHLMLFSSPEVLRDFWRRVILKNRWHYLALIAACFAYAFGLSMSGPKWYRAESTLAFKNRRITEHLDIIRLTENPLPLFLEETPVEQQYDMGNLLYSVNMAKRVIGDRFDELYDPEEYDGVLDFYEKFLMQLGYEYDGELNILKVWYTYKDPELAKEFCNGFAHNLEQFLSEIVQQSKLSTSLKARLAQAREEERVAQAEVERISEIYDVPDLIEAPKEWVKTYAEALERSYRAEAETQALLAALMQVRETRERRNLLTEPGSPPDTTVIRDIILAGLRFRLAMVSAMLEVSGETTTPMASVREQLQAESDFLSDYLATQYVLGLDVESSTLFLALQEKIVENYLYDARAEATYTRLEQLPRLEAEIRPAIRAANVATASVSTLEKMSAFVEVGEEYGIDPIRVIDPALAPTHPIQPAWKTLTYLLPTMLFLATLWFALAERMAKESADRPGPEKRETAPITEDQA